MLTASVILKFCRHYSLLNYSVLTERPLVNHVLLPLTRATIRLFSDKLNNGSECNSNDGKQTGNDDKTSQPQLNTKYSIFRESDAPILLDVYEEKMLLQNNEAHILEEDKDEFYGLNLQRGVHGVFDLEDLIDLLKRDKAEDIFVALLPPEAKYVDYIVIVSSRSRRHMNALAEIVRRVFKKKRLPSDIIPRIEGENSTDWMALDLGNIALHIFSRKTREVYDLESLWSVGPEFDPLINAPEEPLIALLKKHSISLNDISSKGQLL